MHSPACRTALVILAAVAVGCANPFWRRPPPPVPTVPAVVARPIPYPVFETRAFARAVERGTRTRIGAPGAKYWQQYAHYTIAAELVPASSQITGRETVRYYNRSPDTL